MEMHDVDIRTAVRVAAADYDWTIIHQDPNGLEIYAKGRHEVHVTYGLLGQIEVVKKFVHPKDTDVAHIYLHGNRTTGRLINTQYGLVPSLRIFEGSL